MGVVDRRMILTKRNEKKILLKSELQTFFVLFMKFAKINLSNP